VQRLSVEYWFIFTNKYYRLK